MIDIDYKELYYDTLKKYAVLFEKYSDLCERLHWVDSFVADMESEFESEGDDFE